MDLLEQYMIDNDIPFHLVYETRVEECHGFHVFYDLTKYGEELLNKLENDYTRKN